MTHATEEMDHKEVWPQRLAHVEDDVHVMHARHTRSNYAGGDMLVSV